MLNKISTLGKPLTKKQQKTITGGIFDTIESCRANCPGVCKYGHFGGEYWCAG